MKKLFAILVVIVLTSCGAALEPPKSNTDYKNIIGKPIKIGNFEIAQYDFPVSMNWEDAKKACADLGEGWMLPSSEELYYLYQNRVAIGGFGDKAYWSSDDGRNINGYDIAFYVSFVNGNGGDASKGSTSYVRAIRASEQLAALKKPKSNTDYKTIIGKPIKIGILEIAQYDFPEQMNWKDAKIACEALGDGWRLPSLDELNDLYQNRGTIGGFGDNYYWSSTENDNNIWGEVGKYAWNHYFANGLQDYSTKLGTSYVRAIRAPEPPKSNTDYKNIIGKPIKIGNLEIAQYDFPDRMNWEDAKIFCTNLGKGWRLPTKEELNILYQNKVTIGGFAEDVSYWSSTESDGSLAWFQSFDVGYQGFNYKYNPGYVRAIRAF